MPEVATMAIPLAGQALGTLLNNGSQGNRNKSINDIIGQFMSQGALGQSQAFGTGNGQGGIFGPLANNATGNVNQTGQFMFGNENDPGGALSRLQGANQEAFNPEAIMRALGGNDPYGQNIPGMSQGLDQLQQLLGPMSGQNDTARSIFGAGGQSPETQNFFSKTNDMSQGTSVPQQGLQNTANNIFSQGGQGPLSQSYQNAAAQGITGMNPYLQSIMGAAQGMFGNQGQTGPTNAGIQDALGMSRNGGSTGALDYLSGTGQNVLAQNGLTPTGAAGESAALNVLSNGGATPTTDFLQGRGADLASRESLLPQGLVASMASNRAATDYSNNMQAAQKQALARGGGPGATVANGLQNSAMAEYADKGAEGEAKAVQDALVQQQQLQLAQAAQGANMAEQGGGLQNTRFGTAANTLSNLEGVASNRFNTGANSITGASNAATNRAGTGLSSLNNLAGLQTQRELGGMSQANNASQTGINQANVFGNLGLGSGQQDINRLALGGSFSNDVLNSTLQALGLDNSRIQGMNQYGLGAGNLANNGSQDMSSIIQNFLSGNLSAGQQGMNRANSGFNAANTGIGNQQNLFSNMSGLNSSSQNSGNQLLAQLLGYSTGGLSGAAGMYQPRSSTAQNPFAGVLSSAITGFGGKLGQTGAYGGDGEF